MPITQLELARRLRAARKASQVTQATAAEALGVSRSAMSQIERGQRGVSGLELHRMARLYSRDVRELLDDRFEEADPVVALFRAHPELRGSSAAVESLRRCGEIHREVGNLHELLELDSGSMAIPEYSLRAPRSKWEAVQQGSAAAERERRRLDLGVAPLPDVADLLGAQGIATALVQMDDGISGLTLFGANGRVLVAANQSQHLVRRRFSFAHEYAHVLLDRGRMAILSQSQDKRTLTEVRANAFAAAFLMPAAGVRGYVGSLSKGLGSRTRADTFDGEAATYVEGRKRADNQKIELHDVVRMAHHFGVSCAAMLYRLKWLGFVTEVERSYLAARDGAGLAKAIRGVLDLPQPDDVDGRIRVHARFIAMAIEAFTRAEITGRKLDELGNLVGIRGLSRHLLQAGLGPGSSPASEEGW